MNENNKPYIFFDDLKPLEYTLVEVIDNGNTISYGYFNKNSQYIKLLPLKGSLVYYYPNKWRYFEDMENNNESILFKKINLTLDKLKISLEYSEISWEKPRESAKKVIGLLQDYIDILRELTYEDEENES